jgi:hypothetical protein
MNKMPIRVASILLAVSVLVACGAPVRTQQTSIAPNTELLLKADILVGAQITLNEKRFTITKDDLEHYRYGVAGAADKSIESLQVIRLMVEPGNLLVTIRLDDSTLLEKKLYVVEGQTREIRL